MCNKIYVLYCHEISRNIEIFHGSPAMFVVTCSKYKVVVAAIEYAYLYVNLHAYLQICSHVHYQVFLLIMYLQIYVNISVSTITNT